MYVFVLLLVFEYFGYLGKSWQGGRTDCGDWELA